MKSFLDHLKEEVLPSVQVADGGLDISKPAVRAAINAAIAGVVSQPAVTPYVVFNRLSKLLAQYHIVLPKRFLEGDKGVEVFEVKQFGHKMGMTDSGEFVNEVPATHYLFLQYGILSPFGITYAKPVVGGMFKVMARLVDKAELDKLMDMAEITMAEEAEQMQAIAKANAPRDEMHDITSDEKKKGNRAAVAASEKKKLDEQEFNAGQALKDVRDMDAAKNPSGPAAMRNKAEDEALERAGKGLASDIKEDKKPKPVNLTPQQQHDKTIPSSMAAYREKIYQARLKQLRAPRTDYSKNVNEDKGPRWDDYKMVGMKKKGGREVPNCVPKEETQISELNREQGSMINRYIGKTTDNPKREKGRNLALKKKWGDKEFGLPEPKVKAVDRSVNEMAPPTAKFKRMAKHIKAGYAKGGLTDVEKAKAFGATWKAYNRSKMEEGRVEDVMQKPEKEQMKKIAKHAITHGADIKKLVPRKKKVAEQALDETSEKLRLAYTNKAMMQTREKEKKPGEHYKREVGIHRAARLMMRDKKKPVNEETDRDTFQDRYNPDYKYTKLKKRDLSLKKHDE